MATTSLKNDLSLNDEIDIRERSLYARLKRLFSSGTIVRNIGGKKLKVVDTDNLMYATDRNSTRDRFNRVRSTGYNSYSRDFALSYQAARIDLFRDYDCVGPDTIIPLPDGSRPTISELAEKYKDNPQERFFVFSYDHKTDSIKLGKAYHPRKKKGTRIGYKVTFDNGQYVIGSLKHPFMMRDGTYKRIFELRIGDSVMPFYQKEYNCKYNKYKKVYNFSKGWQSEHVIVAEQFDRLLNENEIVHHKDFNGSNNSPENLQIMTKKDHVKFHSNHSKTVLWGGENYENQLYKLKSHPNYVNRKFHRWSGERKGSNNPFYGKSHSDESNGKRSDTLKEVFKNRDQTGEKNPKYRNDITFENVKQKAFEYYKEYSKINLWDFIKHIRCDYSTLQNRFQKEGHNWKSFKQEVESTLNHKIVSIEAVGEVEVYDVTVEEYHNFATDCVFVKNTMDMDPIISCLSPTTYIATLAGFVTIKELSEQYPNGETFHVWSWDKDKHKLTIGNAHHPRKTGTKNLIEVHLDDGEVLKCTPDHRLMLIDGTYKEAGKLLSGESLMPFYHKINPHHGYQEIKSFGKRFKYVHRYIFEDIFEQNVGRDNIHHKNHNRLDNRIENLERLSAIEHCKLHGINLITNLKRKKSCKKLWENAEYRIKALSGIKKFQSSETGKKMMSEHTSLMNKKRWKSDKEYALKMATIFSKHIKSLWSNPEWKAWKRKKHSETIKLKFANDPTYSEKTKHTGVDNGRYNDKITTESILSFGTKFDSLVNFAKCFNFQDTNFKKDRYKIQFIKRRLKEAGYNTWKEYKQNFKYSNHTVSKIVDNNEISDVYDLTVDIYENFAIKQGIIVSNSALDIYADECVHGDTVIPLLNGEKVKISDLYSQNKMNFWVYSLNNEGNVIPELCERVASNGIKKMYKILLDDGTEIKCTANHQWVLSDGKLTTTDKLLRGSSLKAIATKLSNDKFMSGYEMLLDNGSWKYTHRIVANNVSKLKEQRDLVEKKDRVIHHASFNKRNNDPESLRWITWKDHKKIHAQFNKEIWKDKERIHEYKQKTLDGHAKYWTLEKRKEVSERQRKFMIRFTASMTQLEKNYKFGLSGSDNGMFKNGNKIKGSKNGRWNTSVSRPELTDIILYEKDILNGMSFKDLTTKYRLLREDAKILNNIICKKYKAKRIDQIKYKIMGYENYSDFVSSKNHRVVSIDYCGEYESYDLVNVGSTTHVYAIEANDGSKLFTHNCLTPNEMGEMLVVRSDDSNIKDILNNLFYDILNIQFNLWSWTRNMVKYGDFFLRLYISPTYGVYFAEPICAYNVERIENSDPLNKNYVKFQIRPTDTSQADTLEEFEMVHFRLLSDSNFLPYGKGMIEGARRIWKQLSLMEDAMLIHRIMRAPEKRIFKIDIGNIPPNEVDSHIERIITKMKKVPYIDQRTGDYNLRFNLQNMVEDFFLPVRGSDSGNSIENLTGMEWTGTDDIEYLRNKLMAGLKIPKAFLGYEEELCLVPETKIPLLNGKTKTIEELIGDYNNGIKNYVYSIDEDTKNIVPGEIEWAGFTRKNAQLVRVWLDNGEYIDCTPDHNFMTRDGNWTEAQYLKKDQSLMPLYKQKKIMYGKSDYEQVYNPSSEEFLWVHKIIDRHINGELIQPHIKNNSKFNRNELIIIHHQNFDRFDNSPNNLQRISFKEHGNIHKSHTEKTFCSPGAIAYKKSEEFGKKKSAERLNYLKNNPDIKEKLKKNLAQYNYSNEELSELCRIGWQRDIGERKNKLIEDNKKFCKADKMAQAARRKRGFYNPLPVFSDIKEFSQKNGYNTQKIRKELGCSIHYIHNLIYNNGYDSVRDFSKEYKNHKVSRIEWLVDKRDTCDLRIKKYHNFGICAGVIVHNSGKATLAAEDVRFARTIGRVQNFIISSLGQIARVHLYAQGYRDEDLVNFTLELTNPSIIFEKEKVELWSNKLDVAKSAMENKFFSKTWLYKQLFDLTEDDIESLNKELIEDAKQLYRFKSIEEDGNDPAVPFKKIKPPGEEGEGEPGGEPGLGGPEMGGGPEAGNEPGQPPGEPTAGGAEADLADALKEGHGEHADDYERPSQAGDKDATDYPFGEDPLGDKEINEKPRKKSNLIHHWKNNTPFELGSINEKIDKTISTEVMETLRDPIIKSLDAFLLTSSKKILKESSDINEKIEDVEPKTFLDENNIIDE